MYSHTHTHAHTQADVQMLIFTLIEKYNGQNKLSGEFTDMYL